MFINDFYPSPKSTQDSEGIVVASPEFLMRDWEDVYDGFAMLTLCIVAWLEPVELNKEFDP